MKWFAPLIPSSPSALLMLDAGLYGAHLVVVLFVVCGWMFRRTRHLHRLVLIIIWLCWLGVGLYVGDLGYCPLTDWHWQVKAARGETDLPPSYLEYVYTQFTGKGADDVIVSWVAAGTLVAATILSFLLRKKR